MIVLASAVSTAIGEHALSFALGVLVGWWVTSFYRIVKRNGKDK